MVASAGGLPKARQPTRHAPPTARARRTAVRRAWVVSGSTSSIGAFLGEGDRRGQSEPPVAGAAGFGASTLGAGVGAGPAGMNSKIPMHISSLVCSPQWTVRAGRLGLAGLASEL